MSRSWLRGILGLGSSEPSFPQEREADQLLGELVDLALADEGEMEFLTAADEVQRKLASVLESRYPRREYARLLALRIVNLVVARHHFHHRHSRLASRPFQLMLDPVNNCHLACPGCLHTSNRAFAGTYDWPGGRLAVEDHRAFLADHGPTAWGVVFYNWGEPLLHKELPALLLEAKRYLLRTFISSNFSVKFDVESLVRSGLNFLFLSVDGATQEVYSRFRRGGNLDLVLENVRALIAAKKRLGSPVPFVFWRFLTFEHNVHEVERARQLAESLGIDQFSVTTPFAVDWDDPEIRIATSPHEGTYVLRPEASYVGPLDDWRRAELAEPEIEREFARPWTTRLGDGAVAEESRASAPTCRWLYQNLTLDARSRLFPCCMAPEKDKHKVYGELAAAPRQAVNQPDFILSRLGFADRPRFEALHAERGGGTPPYCAVCWEKPDLTYTLERDVRRDLRLADQAGLLSDSLVERLTSWPESR